MGEGNTWILASWTCSYRDMERFEEFSASEKLRYCVFYKFLEWTTVGGCHDGALGDTSWI